MRRSFRSRAAQRATWFAQQFDPEVPILIAHYVELRGELDVELLDRETRAVAYEFQSPLLKVIEIDGQPMQYVDEKAEISVGLVDLPWVPRSDRGCPRVDAPRLPDTARPGSRRNRRDRCAARG